MLTEYVNVALKKAHYEILAEEEGFYGSIPGLQGVWANASSLEACRTELRQVLEEWIVLGLRKGHPIPEIDGINLNIEEAV